MYFYIVLQELADAPHPKKRKGEACTLVLADALHPTKTNIDPCSA